MVKYIGSGGFGSVYSALWMEGPRWNWDDGAQEWARAGPMTVALKRLDNSQKISSSFINQIKTYHKCLQSAPLAETFGITKDPTSNYMIVMKLEIPDDTPKIYAELMQQCWDNEPGNRPTASYLYKKLNWINLIRDNPNPFDDNYYISEEKRFKMASQLLKIYTHPEIHPEAHFTSRPLYFPEFQT
ncbi:unnamed protein product [Rhizophagus irregularis]|nr:unnamed protein product [Rhizophagus irregularis]